MSMPYNGFWRFSPAQREGARLAAQGAGLMRLQGEGLTLERGGRVIFGDLSFAAEAGELVLLQGPNGSGKTSLLKLIAGLLRPVHGEITLSGGISGLATGQQAHLIGHGLALRSGLTVEENLAFWTFFLGGGMWRAGWRPSGSTSLRIFRQGFCPRGSRDA
jgi:ABC-type polysaccharide/polyol phosphate transport system ATPase subunit